ncbi:hypothetical protein ES705_34151 [subsurface metagenome]
MTENNERLEAIIRRFKNLRQNQNKTPEEIRAMAIRYLEMPKADKKLQEVNIIEFAENPDYLGLSFKRRKPQKVILKCLYGMELDQEEQKIFNTLTRGKGRYTPGQEKSEAVICAGARAGKSLIISIVALYEATRDKWKKYLAKGESPYIVIIATRQRQAEAIIGANCARLLGNSPVLKKLIKESFKTELTLKNGVKILSLPANSTAGRGLAICCFLLDEIAFYRLEGPLADELIYNSLRPRQAQFPGCKMLMISTAGSRQGLFFNFFDEGFRVEDRLTIQANTRFVNPEIPQKFLDKEKARDIDNYMREFEGIFSEKLEAFFSYELMQKPFVLAGDLAYKSEYIYCLALDQSGLSGRDRFALAIAHKEGDLAIVDIVRSWETKDLDIILDEIKTLAKTYHLREAIIDKYSKGYVENSFKKIGLEVKIRPSLADIFVVLKAKMIQDKLQLPDRSDLKAGMRNTIAIYNKSNQLTIIHQRGPEGHADSLDAVSGAVFEVAKEKQIPAFYVLDKKKEIDDDAGWVRASEDWNII